MHNLGILPPRKAYSRLPSFFQEVLEAWGKLLPHLEPKVMNRSCVMELPFLQTLFLQHGGRALTCGPLWAVGVTRIGQVVNREGLFDLNSVMEALKRVRVIYKLGHIKTMGARFDAH